MKANLLTWKMCSYPLQGSVSSHIPAEVGGEQCCYRAVLWHFCLPSANIPGSSHFTQRAAEKLLQQGLSIPCQTVHERLQRKLTSLGKPYLNDSRASSKQKILQGFEIPSFLAVGGNNEQVSQTLCYIITLFRRVVSSSNLHKFCICHCHYLSLCCFEAMAIFFTWKVLYANALILEFKCCHVFWRDSIPLYMNYRVWQEKTLDQKVIF